MKEYRRAAGISIVATVTVIGTLVAIVLAGFQIAASLSPNPPEISVLELPSVFVELAQNANTYLVEQCGG